MASLAELKAEDMLTTAAYSLPLRLVLWVNQEAARVAKAEGGKVNKSAIVKQALEKAMLETEEKGAA